MSRYEADGAEGEAEYSSDDTGESGVTKRKGKKPRSANNGGAKAVEDC